MEGPVQSAIVFCFASSRNALCHLLHFTVVLEEHRIRVVLEGFDHSTTLASSSTVVRFGVLCFSLACVTIAAERGEVVRMDYIHARPVNRDF